MPTELRPIRNPEPHSAAPHVRKGVTRLTVDVPSSYRSAPPRRVQPASRWSTPEFIFYGVIFCLVVPIMVWIPVTLSSPSHDNYTLYKRRLSPGWLFGRQVDNSDMQYRNFRNNIPTLGALVFAFLGFKTTWLHFAQMTTYSLYAARLHFLLLFSFCLMLGLHGASVIKIFVILSVNYAIAKSCQGSRLGPLLTWVFNAAVLFANETYDGYVFASIHPSLAALDSIEGIYPRWHVGFNITTLRLISFNMDYFWACRRTGPVNTESVMTEKQRANTPHPLSTYNYQHYIAYALYPPLYIAGPIITFNDFMWQLQRPLSISSRSILGYCVRFLVCLLTMELVLHFMYVVAIKDTKAWSGDTAAELSMIGFWNLIVVWMKLLIPWRFFRLWALADGIDPPENMVRCMANNYSTLGFWRSWHRSYNLWIVRYIYIPLGGTQNALFTTVLVFTFVALWHDLSFRLLAWGWLVSFFILPEIAANHFLPPSKYGEYWWYRHVCAVGAAFNILMMMAANLVGFVIGTDGISYMLQQLLRTSKGLWFLAAAYACLFIAAQVMFEYREEETRQGIYRRC
ncbi:MBOAT-domain-containing protein [Obba rivulosa]|uniref:MBOAT-domain-containing protein n=1 Tax=Obba rivulosa TaxID=1052685 RepID=A0A8E2ARG2_9APHY|nr:MBOAT-domain-containing protein [Obba rivulosa]